jgi:hypothetical protein
MEEPVMPDKWMSVAEAAATLKVHTRTIERRIAGGKIQSRRADDGLLQVLISLPDEPESAPDVALETVRELADNQVTLATGSASALVKFAQDDANRARNELANVRQDAARARHSALAAWCVVAALAVGATIAVGWTTQKITRANDDVRHLTDYAEKVRLESQKLLDNAERDRQRLASERDDARQDAEQAKLAAAEASGKLAAYVEQNQKMLAATGKGPTTRPMNFIQKLATAFSND